MTFLLSYTVLALDQYQLDLRVDTRYNTNKKSFEPAHEISNNLVCATSKASDQHAHTRSLIRAFASCVSIL